MSASIRRKPSPATPEYLNKGFSPKANNQQDAQAGDIMSEQRTT